MSWTRTRTQEDSVLPGIFSQDLREESQELRPLPYGKAAGPGRPTHMHACVCTCTSVCVRVCACLGVCVGGPFQAQVLLGLAPPPTLPPVPVQALTHPRPHCQLPDPAVCCGRCLAVPWQRQNRMYLWIAVGTSPHSQASLAVSLPKDLLGRTAGVQVRDKWCLYGREAEPTSFLGSVAGVGEDAHSHP